MGKSALIYVIGLSMLVCYAFININERATDAATNSIDYYTKTIVHNIAVSGANIGTNMVLMGTDTTGKVTGTFQGGNYAVDFENLPDGKKRVLSVAELILPGKMFVGLARDTVTAVLQYTKFAKFGYFSNEEINGYMSPGSNTTSGGNMWKVTGDSMFGYAHTNKRWNLGGRPYFHDKITAFNPPNTMVYGGVYDPIFNAGSQWGITVNRPLASITNLETIAAAGSALYDGEDVALDFVSDGRVAVKIPALTGLTRNDTVSISTLAPDGVVAVKNADVRVKGTYHGKITVASLKGADPLKGNIWIDGDIAAATNPVGNLSSTDMLGLVSHRMTYITTTDPSTGLPIPRTPASVVNIQAAVYTHDGVFAAQDYNTIPVSGRINLFGALTMAASTSTGKISGGSLVNGFLKSIRHDPRFLKDAPPSFPVSDKFELLSWWEN